MRRRSRSVAIVGAALACLSAPSFGQCDPSGVYTPYGTECFELVEWRGHYYDAGWFHLRSRPVEGGEWVDTGGGISGGGAYTLAEPMLEWNDMLDHCCDCRRQALPLPDRATYGTAWRSGCQGVAMATNVTSSVASRGAGAAAPRWHNPARARIRRV